VSGAREGGIFDVDQKDGQPATLPAARSPGSRFALLLLLVLLVLVAVQAARLIWLLVTPAGPVGTPTTLVSRGAGSIGDFDPFFRLQTPATSNAVTSLPLKLFGTRRDSATGQGFAIIASLNGVQSSFAVGEAIMPGVTLSGVGSDEVTIDRGGTREKLFLDQSVPAPVAAPSVANSFSGGIRTLDRDGTSSGPATVSGVSTSPVPGPTSSLPLDARPTNEPRTLEQQ
jgi:general secretion pathway protein C